MVDTAEVHAAKEASVSEVREQEVDVPGGHHTCRAAGVGAVTDDITYELNSLPSIPENASLHPYTHHLHKQDTRHLPSHPLWKQIEPI